MNNINDLATIEEVKMSLVEVEERLVLLRQELTVLAATEEDDGLAAQLDMFDLLPGKLRPVMTEAQRLEEQLTKSASLAGSVSHKVKELDVVRERVKQVSCHVEAALEAGKCAEGVQKALAQQNMEEAAKFIGRHRALKQASTPELDAATATVEKALSAQLQAAQNTALSASDAVTVAEVARVAALFAALGAEREARSRYCAFVRKRVETSTRARRLLCEKDVDAATGEVKKVQVLSAALSELFESAAGEMMKRLPEASEALGPEVTVSVARAIEDGVGSDAAKLIDTARKLVGLSSLRLSSSLSGSSGSSKNNSLSKAEEAALVHLDSIALLCSRIFLWHRFCEGRLVGASFDSENYNVESNGGRKALESQVNEIVAEYVGLEERFLLSSVQKAIQMDDSEPSDEATTCKMVDYVFFVLQKGAHRAVSTLAGDGAGAVLNIVNSCLDSFLSVLQSLLAQSASKSIIDSSGRVPFAMVLNSMWVSAEFTGRLKNEVEATVKKHFAGNLREIAKVEIIFGELIQTQGAFRNAAANNLKQTVQTLDPMLRDLAELMNASSYVLSEKEYSARQLEDDAWPVRFTKQLDALVTPFRRCLLPACWDLLAKSLASALVARIERLVQGKKCNALGALQFSRDIGATSQALIGLNAQARSEVSRLNQMCIVLCLEKCSDVEELASGPQWRLTPGETRRLLARRVDFKPEEIAAVKL